MLGERIYQCRVQKNLSQLDLADALEVSRQSVSKWENNACAPELDKLVKMCELFGVNLDELVRGEGAIVMTGKTVECSRSSHMEAAVETESETSVWLPRKMAGVSLFFPLVGGYGCGGYVSGAGNHLSAGEAAYRTVLCLGSLFDGVCEFGTVGAGDFVAGSL